MRIKPDKHTKEAKIQIYFEREPENIPVLPKTESVIRMAVTETLKAEAFTSDAEISVTLCNGPYIRTLNAEYRNKDSETDVLSFPIFDEDEEDPIRGESIPLGDIVLNLDRAAEQGHELGHSALREIAFLTIHSMLHLLGYDHERSEEDEEIMCERQRTIIAATETFYKNAEGTDL